MKIIYFYQYFNTPEMSGGTRSYEMARRLVAAGHEVHMITSWVKETDQSDWHMTNGASIHVHYFLNNYNKIFYMERIKKFFRLDYYEAKKCKGFKNIDLFFSKNILSNMSLVTLKVLEN